MWRYVPVTFAQGGLKNERKGDGQRNGEQWGGDSDSLSHVPYVVALLLLPPREPQRQHFIFQPLASVQPRVSGDRVKAVRPTLSGTGLHLARLPLFLARLGLGKVRIEAARLIKWLWHRDYQQAQRLLTMATLPKRGNLARVN